MTDPKPPDVERLQRLAELSETKSRPGPVNADERGRALAVVLKLNGWQPSPFDPVDQELAVRDVAAALREVAKEAQGRALEAYAKEAKSLDGDLLWQLYTRIEKDGPL